MIMLCQSVRDELTHFVLAQLSADETLAVARHLSACADCVREETELRRTTLLVRQWQAAPLSEAVTEQIRSAALADLAAAPRPTRPRHRTGLSWPERWSSLLDAARLMQRQLAPGAFAFVALATLFALIVLVRDPNGAARSGALFLGGMWCASVANGVLALVFGDPGARANPRLRVDVRATALSAAWAGAAVASVFLVVGIAKTLTGEYSELMRLPLYSLASFAIVAVAVCASSRFAAREGGRISGALAALLYFAFSGPLVYIALGFRLDGLWLMAEACMLVFGLLGGLTGDALSARRRA